MICRGPLARLARDETGSVLTFWAVGMAVVFGILALSFDFGRLASTQSELQGFADQVALASAGELDGKDDAITRATAAAAQFITDRQTFGSGDKLLSGATDYTLTFYASRPNDAGTVPATTDPRRASFVRVVVPNQTVAPVFGAVFAALSGQSAGRTQTGANAVAGFTQYACNIVPLMFCAPSAEFDLDDNIGAMVKLRAGGGASAWGPGAFGWMDVGGQLGVDVDGVCKGLTGNNLDMCMIAAIGNRSSCVSQSNISVASGQRGGNFEAAINTLFDVYAASATQLKNNPLYAPSANVRSSFVARSGKCIGNQPSPSTNTMGLPPDDCQVAGTCGRYGNGVWANGRAQYVNKNYGGVDPYPLAVTRYDYYKAELNAMASLPTGGGNPLTNLLNNALRLGLPQCSNNKTFDPERRTMVAAVVDCTSAEVKAGSASVKVMAYAEVFLTAPVGLDGTSDVWVEIVANVGGGSGGSSSNSVVRDVVELYD